MCHRQNSFSAFIVRMHVTCDAHTVEEWRCKMPLTVDWRHQKVSVDPSQSGTRALCSPLALTLTAFLCDFMRHVETSINLHDFFFHHSNGTTSRATDSPLSLVPATLDNHAKKSCSVHDHPPCFHCATPSSSCSSSLFVICSSCGFLAHDQCFSRFQAHFINCINRNFVPSRSSLPAHPCPKCRKLSHLLFSPIIAGCKNFLQHCLTEVVTVSVHPQTPKP